MAANHARSFTGMRGVAVVSCCDIDEARAEKFARTWGIPRWYTNYEAMLDAEKLDGVAVVTPDSMHAPISLAAIARGIAVLCEKPLATNLADAKRMRDAAARRGVRTVVNFSYRDSAAAQAAAVFVKEGGIGRVMHVEASYLQSWLVQDALGDWRTTPSLTWRLSTAAGSAGVLGDVGCHIYDLVHLICGDIREISCKLSTFSKGVKGNRIGRYVLDANDSFVSTISLVSGGIGTVHATRWATGHLNSIRVRVYGDKGAVEVDLDRDAESYRRVKGASDTRKAQWREVRCRAVPTQYERFVKAIKTGIDDPSDFANGARIQGYLDASERSAKQDSPVIVKL